MFVDKVMNSNSFATGSAPWDECTVAVPEEDYKFLRLNIVGTFNVTQLGKG